MDLEDQKPEWFVFTLSREFLGAYLKYLLAMEVAYPDRKFCLEFNVNLSNKSPLKLPLIGVVEEKD